MAEAEPSCDGWSAAETSELLCGAGPVFIMSSCALLLLPGSIRENGRSWGMAEQSGQKARKGWTCKHTHLRLAETCRPRNESKVCGRISQATVQSAPPPIFGGRSGPIAMRRAVSRQLLF